MAAQKLSSICVFCGSGQGARPEYGRAAAALGAEIARRGMRLVYGGGDVGTMGVLARAALSAGGKVTGVIPKKLYELVDQVELTELVVAADMHERKAKMYAESDAFIALPGGVGTMDELFEAWTWRGIGYHDKPIGILDVCGYYAPLLAFLRNMVGDGFLGPEQLEDIVVETEAAAMLDALAAKGPLTVHKRPERSRPVQSGAEKEKA
jgi:TIGR00730 family protein